MVRRVCKIRLSSTSVCLSAMLLIMNSVFYVLLPHVQLANIMRWIFCIRDLWEIKRFCHFFLGEHAEVLHIKDLQGLLVGSGTKAWAVTNCTGRLG